MFLSGNIRSVRMAETSTERTATIVNWHYHNKIQRLTQTFARQCQIVNRRSFSLNNLSISIAQRQTSEERTIKSVNSTNADYCEWYQQGFTSLGTECTRHCNEAHHWVYNVTKLTVRYCLHRRFFRSFRSTDIVFVLRTWTERQHTQ